MQGWDTFGEIFSVSLLSGSGRDLVDSVEEREVRVFDFLYHNKIVISNLELSARNLEKD